ncbi:hypothetical protein TNCV_1753931 [Trichonephila clavipes]|nr:hypothetical protein TNCV_1753931 [Trichonephila clavipes]
MLKNGKSLTKIMKRIEVESENLEEALDKGCQDTEETEEGVETEEEEVVCGCQHFRPVPRGMRGRRKEIERIRRVLRFPVEKPEMWEEGITFQNGLGKDVWGMVQRYLRQDLMWFHIMVKQDVLIHFVRKWKRFGINVSYCPFGVCAMDW